ncbi:TPA: protein kinase [Candidatus Woesearchaeota archaeon]|nr:protein kinase [Candidatus Woesearchaeota archaeon]
MTEQTNKKHHHTLEEKYPRYPKKEILGTLEHIRRQELIKRLYLQGINHPSRHIREVTASMTQELNIISEEFLDEAIRTYMNSPHPEVRKEIVGSAAYYDNLELALEVVLQGLQDKDSSVREEAAREVASLTAYNKGLPDDVIIELNRKVQTPASQERSEEPSFETPLMLEGIIQMDPEEAFRIFSDVIHSEYRGILNTRAMIACQNLSMIATQYPEQAARYFREVAEHPSHFIRHNAFQELPKLALADPDAALELFKDMLPKEAYRRDTLEAVMGDLVTTNTRPEAFLDALMDDEDCVTRSYALEMIEGLWKRRQYAAIRHIVEKAMSDNDDAIRLKGIESIQYLSDQDKDAKLQYLEAAINDPNPYARDEAVKIIAGRLAYEPTPGMEELVQRLDEHMQKDLRERAEFLKKDLRKAEEYVDHIAASFEDLKDHEPETMPLARFVQTLAASGPYDFAEHINEYIDENRPAVSEAAVRLLRKFVDTDIRRYLHTARELLRQGIQGAEEMIKSASPDDGKELVARAADLVTEMVNEYWAEQETETADNHQYQHFMIGLEMRLCDERPSEYLKAMLAGMSSGDVRKERNAARGIHHMIYTASYPSTHIHDQERAFLEEYLESRYAIEDGNLRPEEELKAELTTLVLDPPADYRKAMRILAEAEAKNLAEIKELSDLGVPNYIPTKKETKTKGVTSKVYKARNLLWEQIGIKKPVALKVMDDKDERVKEHEQKGGASFEIMWKNDIEELQRLSHPNLAKILDAGIHEGRMYIAQEYYGLGSLETHLDADFERTIRDTLNGLAEIHRLGRVHRDIKPANIFVAEDGRTVVGDFGTCRKIEDMENAGFKKIAQRYEGIGLTHGSSHAAPETLLYHKADQRSDVYSMGLVMVRMLTRQKYSIGMTREELKKANKKARQRHYENTVNALISQIPQHTSTKIVDVVRKCLAYNPEDRYTDARELKEAFDAAYQHDETVARKMIADLQKNPGLKEQFDRQYHSNSEVER